MIIGAHFTLLWRVELWESLSSIVAFALGSGQLKELLFVEQHLYLSSVWWSWQQLVSFRRCFQVVNRGRPVPFFFDSMAIPFEACGKPIQATFHAIKTVL